MEFTQLPEGKVPTIRVLAMPRDTNAAGDIFGGWIMSQVDMAGAIAAYDRTKGRVVTVSVNSFVFHAPVYVGDVVSCYAHITRVGNTSLTVDIEVYAERGRDPQQCVRVTEAVCTYVAVDENGKPRPVDQNP